MAIRSALILFWLFGCAATSVDARQDDITIARSLVVGQAYATGNIVVAGFVADAARSWPQTITVARLLTPAAGRLGADFMRPLRDERPDAFAGGEAVDPAQDLFVAVDDVFDDRPVALYKSRVTIAESTSVFGWSGTLGLRDLSYQNRGQPRPVSSRERDEIAAEKRKLPRDVKCTTVPRWIDAAKILLTAGIASSKTTIRLSSYETPGCLGHLATIYILDVITPGREPRRFEFRHQQGVL